MLKHITYFVFLFIYTLNIYAQSEGEVEERVVVIEKESKLDLPIANRNFEKIPLVSTTNKQKPLNYVYKDISIELPSSNPKIKVPLITPDPLPKLYGNYFKAGVGNYSTTFLEGFINNKRSDKVNYGVHLKHLASANGPVKSDLIDNFSRNSQNQLEGYVKYFYEKTIFSGEINYNRSRINYYGFEPGKLTPSLLEKQKENLKQIYSIFSIGGAVEKNEITEPLSYKAEVNYFNFSDAFNAKESEVIIGLSSKYLLEKDKYLSVNSQLSMSNRIDSNSIDRLYFIIRPAYHFRINDFKLKAGINIGYSNDSTTASGNIHLYPSAEISLPLLENKFNTFAGIDGSLQKNTLRSHMQQNAYLGNNILLYNTNKSFEFYAGVQGVLVDKINLLTKISLERYKNLFFYNNGIADSTRFAVFYNNGITNVIHFKTEGSIAITEKFKLGTSLHLYNYSIANSDSIKLAAWHRPTAQWDVSASYNLLDKIYFNFNFYYIGGITARNFITSPKSDRTLPSILDLNLKVDYKISSAFGAFLEFNNILGKKYQLYQYYPVKGVNILAGITYSF